MVPARTVFKLLVSCQNTFKDLNLCRLNFLFCLTTLYVCNKYSQTNSKHEYA